MSVPTTVWHGTADEGFALLVALAHNCTCETNAAGVRTNVCQPHRSIVKDQEWLDGLLFDRWLAPRLMREEFCLT